jgi:ribosomal protein S18 acetylase RimI-like enzyme
VSLAGRYRIVDWRSMPADSMTSLYAAEAERWSALDWSTSTPWEQLECARRVGAVSGLVALDNAGQIAGWTAFHTRNRMLQVSIFHATSEAVTSMLLEQALSAQRLSFVGGVTFFAPTTAPGLTAALRRKGLAVDRYWYLGREVARLSPPPPLSDVRKWRHDDVPATADLLARAYDPRVESRPFVPEGGREQWLDYVEALTRGGGCGPLVPEASLCIPAGPNRLLAVALVTRIAPSTAHLAQLVVDPMSRRRRLATQLIALVSSAAAQVGCARLTLLVAGSNRPARALYEDGRFQPIGSFVSAGALQPRRSTSAAPAGALMTRR